MACYFWERGGQFLDVGQGFVESNYKFYFTTFIWLTICVRTERLKDITCYLSLMFLAYVVLLKVFLIVFYFIIAYLIEKVNIG